MAGRHIVCHTARIIEHDKDIGRYTDRASEDIGVVCLGITGCRNKYTSDAEY
ncbi:MAG: hypothetical protein ABSC14_10990 [Desulfomonilia bacterium]